MPSKTYILIQNTDSDPPNHRLISKHYTFDELKLALCLAIYGETAANLSTAEFEEFKGYWEEFHESGELTFEGDPGVAWAVL